MERECVCLEREEVYEMNKTIFSIDAHKLTQQSLNTPSQPATLHCGPCGFLP